MKEGRIVFVYGTLKRGGSNHGFLANQSFVGVAQTVPGYTLFELSGYPGMVPHPTAVGVKGEVWRVDPPTLAQLDKLEGIPEGLYRREVVPLLPPFSEHIVEAYLYNRSIDKRREVGSSWDERRRA